MIDSSEVGFEEFRQSWLESIQAGQPSTRDLGRRFSLKLVSQWIDASEESADIVLCDGSCDGGIDIALLDTGSDPSADALEESGDTWYLVQSKYGSAFTGINTLLSEGQKVIDTLDGKRAKLNSLAEGTLERLTNFRNGAGPSDRIVLVFATERPLSEAEGRVLQDLRAMGRSRIGQLFDVETISIATIYNRIPEEALAEGETKLTITIGAHVVQSGDDLLVGSVQLIELYKFLRKYREETGDLDRLYEKNVRRFLGGKGKVNKGMQATLRDAPERFGLYNNGITIVVSGYTFAESSVQLIEPYIVNGCQTSRTIWEVFHQRLDAGGTGTNPEIEAWKKRVDNGVVVTKIVKVGNAGETLLQAITRYTNSQNAVREKDFLALTGDFRTWQAELGNHNIYLEIQRGGWDSQKALQNQNLAVKNYSKSANAADLIKVYGSGWLGEAGMAFGKNPPFLPDGSVFKRIVNNDADQARPFGAVDLYAAYLLQQGANGYGFGRGAGNKNTRRQTRFLFYFVVIDLLKDALSRGGHKTDLRTVSDALVAVLEDAEAGGALLDSAIEVIDSYFTQGTENSVFEEAVFVNAFPNDLSGFLKWEKLGRPDAETPVLRGLLAITKQVMGRSVGGSPSQRSILLEAIKGAIG